MPTRRPGWPQPTTVVLGLALIILGGTTACSPQPTTASLVINDARVWTGDPEQPWAEAVASVGDQIVAVGSEADIASWIGETTTVIHGAGGMLAPGFIDTHVHMLAGGESLASVQLRDAATPEEFTARIQAFAATLAPGEWVLNGVWDHKNWGGTLPDREWIDAVTPDNPVWIQRLDGHMGLANSLALQQAGIDNDTDDIEGGTIVRDPSGRITGVLKDNAMMPLFEAVPRPSDAQLDRYLEAAMNYVASGGVTTVHDVSAANWNALDVFRRANDNGNLRTRVYAITPLEQWETLRDDVDANGRGDTWLRTGGLKGFMDGSLGSHTAAFIEPFSDNPPTNPDESGFLVNSLDSMRAWVEGADNAGLQIAVHAIGDRAIRDLLDIYADVAETHGPRDRRFRMEHAQHIHADDIPRFAALDVIASMQPYHAIDDGRWAETVIGPERALTTYAFDSLIKSGAHVAFGSDWFVAPATPLEGIYAAVTRRTLDDAHPSGWVPTQKITVEQALHAYTTEGAYASFDEDKKGRIKVGMLADMVLLDSDLTAIPSESIADVGVVKTIVGGKVMHSAD